MIDRETYLDLKKHIKCMCYNNVEKMCSDMNLNKEERTLLLNFYNGVTRTKTCFELSISTTYYLTHMRILFSKINDYLKTYSD